MNYLSVGEAIKTHLEAVTGNRVYASRDVDMGKTQSQRAPCIFVSYGGEGSVEQSGDSSLVRQTWIILVAVANEKANTTGIKANRVAGEMLGDIVPKLIGFLPGDGFTSLKQIASPVPHGYDDKFLYYPVAFETSTRIKGVNNGC